MKNSNELQGWGLSLPTDYIPTDNDLDNIDRMIEQGFLEDQVYREWEEDEFALQIIE